MLRFKKLRVLIIVLIFAGSTFGLADDSKNKKDDQNKQPYAVATLAGGCFWCMQPPYDELPGVISTTVGYTGGIKVNPTYEEVSTGTTGHVEAVQIVFDSTKIGYWDLLQEFWRNIDPTDAQGQFSDQGSQYRTAIFYYDEKQKEQALKSRKELEDSNKFDRPITTGILPADKFYPAEEYHQEFYKNHPLRYLRYKNGSGRTDFLKEKWGTKEENH